MADTPKLPPGFSRETTIRRDAAGQWFHDGEPVVNEQVARAFDRWIDRADDGRYILRNDVNWAYVEIEGAPFFVRSVDPGAVGVTLFLSDQRTEALDPTTVRAADDGRIFCRVRGGAFEAEFTRKATLQLEPLVEEDDEGVYLNVNGVKARV